MKIESHTFTHQMEHTFTYEKTDTFEQALSALSLDETAPKNAPQALREIDLVEQIKFTLIQQLLQLLFGASKEISSKPQNVCSDNALHVKQPSSNQFRLFETVEVNYKSTYQEAESLRTQTQGTVKTGDGRSIDINLELTMQRSFYSKTALTQSVFIDPLVINLDGTLPELCNTTFSFDLDCDGKVDQISSLAKNNGFLAFDTNQNGQIDDGSELFGTKSGNGFKDLNGYDSDKNQWIDENDPIFEGLRIWCNDELIGLGEAGLGAIYLGAQPTPYMLKNDDNETLGKLRQSTLFLFESGEVGTIAQVDFAKRDVKEPMAEALAQV